MSFYARDKLYNEYLRRNMRPYLTRVKVNEILPYLPCLTQTDKEEIEAKRDCRGNTDAMQLLIDCLKRRDNWVEEFIVGLEICEQRALADELRERYDSYRAPPVTRAHVSPPPPANPSLPIPKSVVDTRAAQPPKVQAAVIPTEPAQATPPPPPPVVPPPSPAPQVTMATEPAQAPQPPATPDIAPSAAAAFRELFSDEIVIHNVASAPDIQVPGVGTEITSVPEPLVLHAEAPVPAHDNGLQTAHMEVNSSEAAAPVQNDPSSNTETSPAAEATLALDTTKPPLAPAAAAGASPALVLTPEKHPVQETSPPEVTLVPQQPEENSYPVTQVTENNELIEHSQEYLSQQTAQTAVTHSPFPVDSFDGANSTLSEEEADGYLSKPGVLIGSAEEPFSRNVTLQQTSPGNVSPEEPYSGNSSRLEISDPAPAAELVLLTPATKACAAVAPEPSTTAGPSPCQENGVKEEPLPLFTNEPEENLFESTCQSSLGDQQVLTNVVHVSGEPSVQNHDGQTPSMLLAHAVCKFEDPPAENNDSQSQITLGGACAVSVTENLTGTSVLGGAVSVSEDLTGSSLGNKACTSQDAQSHILNGQATKKPTSAPAAGCGVIKLVTGASSNENSQISDPAEDKAALDVKLLDQEDLVEKGGLQLKNLNKNHLLLMAAALSAIFVAWRLKMVLGR